VFLHSGFAGGCVSRSRGRLARERRSRRCSRGVQNSFLYSIVLGLILAGLLQIGFSTHFLLDFFTSDQGTQAALANILTLIIVAQPLNSLVFAADGVLQGASEFTYQAKSMVISGATAAAVFVALQGSSSSDTLLHVWTALISLQVMRGLTSAVKIVDNDGPIKLLGGNAEK
jgi:Na+-driven multidrug efflux pump